MITLCPQCSEKLVDLTEAYNRPCRVSELPKFCEVCNYLFNNKDLRMTASAVRQEANISSPSGDQGFLRELADSKYPTMGGTRLCPYYRGKNTNVNVVLLNPSCAGISPEVSSLLHFLHLTYESNLNPTVLEARCRSYRQQCCSPTSIRCNGCN